MSNPWFRMYNDFIYDEKIEFLSFEDQRHFVFLLCMKNLGLLDKEYPQQGMLDRVIARRLGLYGEAFDNAKIRLMAVGVIDVNWQPVGWNSRQFVSDSDPSHAERQRRYRERQKEKASSDVTGDVTVTVLDTDTDTDIEKKEKAKAFSPPIGDVLLKAWKEVRKAKRAGSITELVWKGIVREAKAAGITEEQAITICCERGWQSFKADWVKDRFAQPDQPKPAAQVIVTPQERRQRDSKYYANKMAGLKAELAKRNAA